MNCTLTEKQQELRYISVVASLEEAFIKNPGKPFDTKSYIKSVYDRIVANPKGSVDLGLQYAALIPHMMINAKLANWDTAGKLLASQDTELINLANSFKDVQNIIDYLAAPALDPQVINEIKSKQPSMGEGIPVIKVSNSIQQIINDVEFSEARPLEFTSTTGQQAIDKKNNVEDPSKILTYNVLDKILSRLFDTNTTTGSDLEYYKHTGIQLRVLNETELPDNATKLNRAANSNYMVAALVDNNGNFLSFDKDGFVTDKGETVYFSYRIPTPEQVEKSREMINEVLSRMSTKVSPEVLEQTRKNMENNLSREIENNKQTLKDYRNTKAGEKILTTITGGSKGYVKSGWTDTNTIKVSDEELKTIHFKLSGNNLINMDGVSKEISIKGIDLGKLSPEVIKNLAEVLTSKSSKLNDTDKIDYLKNFVFIDNKNVSVTLGSQSSPLILEVKGNTLDLSKVTPEEVINTLLRNGIHFGILNKTTRYTEVKPDGTKTPNQNYLDLLKKYTQIDAKPNTEGKIVELNGYFTHHYSPSIQREFTEPEEEVVVKKQRREMTQSNLLKIEVTPEQDKKANTWWSNSPLSKAELNGEKLVSLEVLRNIVNSDAYATWSIAGITLNRGSHDTAIYHEAWHAFSQLFLTREEKDQLYSEVGKQKGSFSTIVNRPDGNSVQDIEFSKASPKQLEEYIAEKFRQFATAKGDVKGISGFIKSIFRRIKAFLNKMFNGISSQDTLGGLTSIKSLNDMFQALYVGNINKYSPSVDNVQFSLLNMGMISTKDKTDEKTYKDSKLIKDSIDGLISQILNERSSEGPKLTIRGITKNSNKKILYEDVYNELEAGYKKLSKKLYNLETKIELTPSEKDKLSVLRSNTDLLAWTLKKENFGNIDSIIDNYKHGVITSGVVGYHMANSAFADILKKSTPEDDPILLTDSDEKNTTEDPGVAIENEVNNSIRMGGKAANDTTSIEDANKETLYLVKSLLSVKNGKQELNELGFPVLVNLNTTWNEFSKKLTGTQSLSELYRKIEEQSKYNQLYTQLLDKLGNPAMLTYPEEENLWMKFRQDFNRPIQKLMTYVVQKELNKDIPVLDESGNKIGYSTKETHKVFQASSDYTQAINKWKTNFDLTDPDNEFVLQTPSGRIMLNIETIVNKFLEKNYTINKEKVNVLSYSVSPKNTIPFLNAIGIGITASDATTKDLRDHTSTITYLAKIIGEVYNEGIRSGKMATITEPIEFLSKSIMLPAKEVSYTALDTSKSDPKYKPTKTSSQVANINRLAEIETTNSSEYSGFNRLTAEGKQKSEQSLPGSASQKILALQEAGNINELGKEGGYYEYMGFLNPENSTWANAQIILKSLFDTTGKPTGATIELHDHVGGSYQDKLSYPNKEEGVSMASMGKMDKFITDFNSLLTRGIITHQQAGSKNTFLITRLSKLDTYPGKKQNYLYIDSTEFISNDGNKYNGFERTYGIILPYIQAELDRIVKYNNNKEFYNTVVGFSDKTTGSFSLFADILSTGTKDALQNTKITDKMYEKLYADLKVAGKSHDEAVILARQQGKSLSDLITGSTLETTIKKELKYYFDGLYKDYQSNLMNTYGYVAPQIREDMITSTKGNPDDLTNSEGIRKLNDAALRSFTYNNWINTVETSLLYNGDPSTFNHTKDEAHKRFSTGQSAGTNIPFDRVSQDIANGKNWGTPLTLKTTGKTKLYDGTFTKAIMQDFKQVRPIVNDILHELFMNNAIKKGLTGDKLLEELYGRHKDTKVLGTKENPEGGKMKPYHDLTVTDGQGYISLDAYRTWLKLEGDFSDEQETLFNKIVAGEKPTLDEVTEMFPVLKLQHAGTLKTDKGLLPIHSIDKFALFPLIPSVIENTPLEKMHSAMMEQGIDYTLFQSGAKANIITSNTSTIGNPKVDSPFNSETGEFNNKTIFTKNVSFAAYLKRQVKMHTNFEGKSIFSTQLRTLLSTGLIEEGIPVDYPHGKNEWNKLTEPQKRAESPYYKLVSEYEGHVDHLLNLTKDKLVLGVKGWTKDTESRYHAPKLKDGTSDYSSMIKFIKDEFKKQGLTEHQLQYIDHDDQGKLLRDLSGSPIGPKMERMLFALINNRVVRQKINGEPLIEVSTAYTQKFKKATDSDNARYGQNDIKFYTPDPNGKNSTAACQVKIAFQNSYIGLLQLKHPDGAKIGTLDRLNSLLTDEQWLNEDNNRKKITLTGVRIPVQGLNSMEFAEIAEFLPPEAGNIIILPQEIVAKSGTDFDVDKLTTYMATIGKNGEWLSATDKPNSIPAVQNSLMDSIVKILQLPGNAVRLLTANDTHLTKPYATEMEPHVQEKNWKQTRGLNGKNVSKGISSTRPFEYDFNLDKHQNFFTGKTSLAQAANANPENILYNSAGQYIPETLKFKVYVDGKEEKVEVQTRIYLPTNKSTFIVDGKEMSLISLSKLLDSSNQNEIAEIISQLMNGYVDVEKDAWVAFIQGNKEVTPVILFLLQTGVPIQDIVYYVNNPLIRNYISELKSRKGVFGPLKEYNPLKAKSEAKKAIWQEVLGNKKAKTPNVVTIADRLKEERKDTPFPTALLQGIAKNEYNIKDKDVVDGYLHYLYLEQVVAEYAKVIPATKFDTKKVGNFSESHSRTLTLEQLKQETSTPLGPINYIAHNSVISGFDIGNLASDAYGFAFPISNNEDLNKYIDSKLKDYASRMYIQNTTGLVNETFPTRFKNTLLMYAFVNDLKSFSMGESNIYKGISVKYINTGDKTIQIKTVDDKPVIHINENLLKKEFKNSKYLMTAKGPGSYSEQGLSPLNTSLFYMTSEYKHVDVGEKEYYAFVVERENLRMVNPIENYSKTHKFQTDLSRLTEGDKAVYHQRSNESPEEFKDRVSKKVYEDYLRNMALENTYNMNAMFFDNQQNGITSFARKLTDMIKKYPELKNKYNVLQQLTARKYSEVDTQEGDEVNYLNNLINIALRDEKDLTPESIEQYHNDLVELADLSKEKFNTDTQERKEDNERISDLFKKFPVYVYLQGGMNKNIFAYPSILPNTDSTGKSSLYSIIMNDAISKLGTKLSPQLLDSVFKKTMDGNQLGNRRKNQVTVGLNSVTGYTLPALLRGTRKESIITPGERFSIYKRMTPTSITGQYSIDTNGITKGEEQMLEMYLKGKGYVITKDNSFPDASIKLRTDSIGNMDEDIQSMTEALGSGIGLVFNETGYGNELKDVDLKNHLDQELYEKLGYINTGITTITPVTPEVKSTAKINIYAGAGENTDLSNFAIRPFKTNIGTVEYSFNTVEGAFQAAKLGSTTDFLNNNKKLTPEQEKIFEIFQTVTGSQAKAMGSKIKGLNTTLWDSKSSSIMKRLLEQSFKQNPEALKKLLSTGNAELTHIQDKGKWGKEFPKLLMEVRSELSNLASDSEHPVKC